MLTSYLFWLRFALITVGRASLPILVGDETLEKVEVQTDYLAYTTRNIQSFGLSLIYVVSIIDKTGKKALKLAIQ